MVIRGSPVPRGRRFSMMSTSFGVSRTWMCTAIIWSSSSMVRCCGFFGAVGVSAVVASVVVGGVGSIVKGSGRSPATEGVEPRVGIGDLVINCANTG